MSDAPVRFPGLAGTTVIVTGAAHGIGLAVSTYLCDQGAEIVAVDRDEAALAAAGLGDATRVVWDVSDDQEGLLAAILDSRPGATMLFNNIGVMDGRGFLDLPEDALRRSLDANLIGQWLFTRAFVRHLLAVQAQGSIVFNLSLHTARVRMFPDYSVSKAGLLMLVQELAFELGPSGIRVNSISPGAIDTWSDRVPEPVEHRRQSEQKIPIGRLGDPADVAPAVAFLLDSSLSGYVTGADLRIDGGLNQYNWLHTMYGSAASEIDRTGPPQPH